MPDTYTSQFSGEEIDSALRAAHIISGADTPAALREKLEIYGSNTALSPTDPTTVETALKYRTNPNLLDNWYFGRPVNQRKGYYIPAGIKYNTLSWTEAGTTDKAYPVIGYIGQDPLITVNGTNYIVGKSVQVPGYCAAGYTVDRWYSLASSKTIKVESDGFAISDTEDYSGFIQRIEYQSLLGKTVTFSVLARRTAQGSQKPYITVMIGNNKFEGWGEIVQSDDYQLSSCTVTLSDTAPSEGYFFVDIVGMAGSSVELLAAKLELGSAQTLAHKEGDKWILNEIPDFGEQLRRCQRHAFSPLYEAYATAVICNLFVSSVANGVAFGEVTLPVSMRNKPVFSGNASKFWIVAENGGGASHPTAIAVMGLSADKVMIQVNGSYAANTQYILYVEDPFTSSDFLLSADL